VRDALQTLAKHDLKHVRKVATSALTAMAFLLDNVQAYSKPRDMRVHKVPKIHKGTATTAVVMVDFNPVALDLDYKLRRIRHSRRRDLTFEEFWKLTDHRFVEAGLIIEWLQILIEYVISLRERYGSAVERAMKKEATHHTVPLEKTKVYPLPITDHDDTETTGLHKALRDILEHLGQTQDSYNQCVDGRGGKPLWKP
jgi:hypothetical protein